MTRPSLDLVAVLNAEVALIRAARAGQVALDAAPPAVVDSVMLRVAERILLTYGPRFTLHIIGTLAAELYERGAAPLEFVRDIAAAIIVADKHQRARGEVRRG